MDFSWLLDLVMLNDFDGDTKLYLVVPEILVERC